MSGLLDYLVKLSVGLAVAYVFYYVVLRRHTFYSWNRWYLLLYSMLAFCIPLIDVSMLMPEEQLPDHVLNGSVPRLNQFLKQIYNNTALADAPAPEQPVNWLLIVLVLGIIVMIVRLCLHFYFYIRIKREAQLVSDDGFMLYHIDREIVPFSFGDSVFINPSLHSEEELEKIILHEYVHVRQKHTFDNLWAEMLSILNWYNPFAWLIRYAVRQNLEYIADDQVLQHNVDAKKYQYLLLKVTGVPESRFTSAFNFASLKQRIIMMNKARTPKIYLTRFLFLAPLIAVILVAFRPDIDPLQLVTNSKMILDYRAKPDTNSKQNRFKDSFGYCAGIILDAATEKPITNAQIDLVSGNKVVKTFRTDHDGFYYSEINLDPSGEDMFDHSLKLVHPNYHDIISGLYASDFSLGYGRVLVNYISANKDSTVRSHYYGPPHQSYPKTAKSEAVKADVKQYLTKLLPAYHTEIQLIADFKKYHPFPKNVLTKYKNGYFDRYKELIGYEGVTTLFLDGKKATYNEINEAFRTSPYLLDETKMSKEWSRNRICSKIKFITFPLYKDAPPQQLLTGNVEIRDPSDFDLSVLDKEVYFLDGFRQVFGMGSNLRPLKTELKKVMLFKGRLARYYDPRLTKIWWIETRPENEVFGRPDLAKN